MGGLHKSVRAAGVGLSTLAASFFMSAPAYAAGVEDSQIVTGTEQLIGDLTTWLMVLAPVVSGLLIIYFCIRRGMADEMDQKKWNNRIVVAVVSCIGAVFGFRHPEPDPRLLSVSRGRFRSTGDYHALLSKSIHQ